MPFIRLVRPRHFSSLAPRKCLGQRYKNTLRRGAGYPLGSPAWASLDLIEQPPLYSRRDRLAAVPDVELLQDVGDMVLDRMGRDVQLRGDCLVGQAFRLVSCWRCSAIFRF